jgi:chromosome partitioning protein
MLIVIGTSKGGEGKSTLATNLAVLLAHKGRDALLVDADPQGSAYSWQQRREEMPPDSGILPPPVDCVRLEGKIRNELSRLREKYEYLIVDTQGRKSVELMSSALIADVILMPVQVGFFSVWALGAMADILADARTINENVRFLALVNRASTNKKINDWSEFQQILDESAFEGLGAKLLGTVIYERRLYRTASGYGLGVVEMPAKTRFERETKAKAVKEMESLYQEVFGHD